MANIKSAIKRAEQSEERRLRNAAVKSQVRTAVRKYHEAVTGGDSTQAAAALSQAFATIDKAATKGVLHKNTASRKKSRLAKDLKAAAQ